MRCYLLNISIIGPHHSCMLGYLKHIIGYFATPPLARQSLFPGLLQAAQVVRTMGDVTHVVQLMLVRILGTFLNKIVEGRAAIRFSGDENSLKAYFHDDDLA